MRARWRWLLPLLGLLANCLLTPAHARTGQKKVVVTTFGNLAEAVRSAGSTTNVIVVAADIVAIANNSLEVPAGANLTIKSDAVNGSRHSIAADNDFAGALFAVPQSSSLTLQNLEITGFRSKKGEAAVVDAGNLTVIDCAWNSNFFNGPNPDSSELSAAGAAAVYNRGTAALGYCDISNNVAQSNEAGAIRNEGVLSFAYCTFRNNTGRRGSAIYSTSSTSKLNISHSSFLSNSAETYAAAVFLSSGGSASILRTSFDDNHSLGRAVDTLEYLETCGGVVSVAGETSILQLENCSFSSELRETLSTSDRSKENPYTGSLGGGCLGVIQASVNVLRTKFISCSAPGGLGGAFYNGGGSVLFEDSCFQDNHAVYGVGANEGPPVPGAPPYNPPGQVTLKRCNMTGTFSTSGVATSPLSTTGGALYNNENMILDSCVIAGMRAGQGGGIYNDGNLNVSGSTIRSNQVEGVGSHTGGAIYNYYGQLRVLDTGFSNNTAWAGGVVMNSHGVASFTNSSFQDNSAGAFGGVYSDWYGGYASANFQGCTFRDNVAEQDGGGLQVTAGGDVTLVHSELSSCSAQVFGGAIYSDELATVNITDVTFINNTAGLGGGAVQNRGKMTVSASLFRRNHAEFAGGAVYGDNLSTTNITDVRFINNTAGTGGGAVQNRGKMIVSGSIFQRNHAETCADIRNSALLQQVSGLHVEIDGASSGNSMHIHNSVFQDSIAAAEGGSVCNIVGNLTLQDSAISGCRATTGGAIFVGDTKAKYCQRSSTMLQNVTLFNNSAMLSGGAIAVQAMECDVAGKVTIANSTVSSNTAIAGGGALISCTAAATCPTFDAVTFLDNIASGGGGGALYSTAMTPNISSCPDGNQPFGLQGCRAWRGNAVAGGYGDVFATPPRRLEVSQSNFSDVVSGTALSNLSVRVLDGYGQLVAGGPNASLAIQAVLWPALSPPGARIVSQPIAVASGGVAEYSAFAVRSRPGVSTINITVLGFEASVQVRVRACVLGEHTNDEGDLCVPCQQPTYSFDPNLTTCLQCPKSATCYGGAQVVAQVGYWQSALLVDQVVQCQNERACSFTGRDSLLKDMVENGTWTEDAQCATGYKGNMCAVCEEGYGLSGQVGSFECKRCGRKFLTALTLTGLAIVSVLAVVLIIRSASDLPLDAVDGHMGVTRGVAIPAMAKLLVSYLQVTSITFAVQLRWPAFVSRALGVISSACTVGIQLFSPNCLLNNGSHLDTSFQVLLALAALPFVAASLPALFWTVRWHYLHAKWKWTLRPKQMEETFAEYVKPRYVLSVIVAEFFLWPAVTTHIVALFSCITVNSDGPNVPDSAVGRFWELAMNQRCYTGTHMVMVATIGIPGIIIFCVGVPLVTFIILYSKRDSLYTEATAEYYSFLYAGYKRKFFYWECIVCLQKLALIYVLVFVSQLGTEQQILLSLGLACTFTLMSRACRPFASNKLCNMQTMAWVSNCSLLYVGWLFFLPLSSALQTLLSVVFGVIYIGSILLFLMLLSAEVLKGIKERKLSSPQRQQVMTNDDVADALREALDPAFAGLGTTVIAVHGAYTFLKRSMRRYARTRFAYDSGPNGDNTLVQSGGAVQTTSAA